MQTRRSGRPPAGGRRGPPRARRTTTARPARARSPGRCARRQCGVSDRHAEPVREVVVACPRGAELLTACPPARRSLASPARASSVSASYAAATEGPASRTRRGRPVRRTTTTRPSSSRRKCSVAVEAAMPAALASVPAACSRLSMRTSTMAPRDRSANSSATDAVSCRRMARAYAPDVSAPAERSVRKVAHRR
jgi:hypothetical protein